MKKWSVSTKVTVLVVILLVGWVVARSVHFNRMATLIAHQSATPAALSAERDLILHKRLGRLFKDSSQQAKKQAIRTAQIFAADRTMVEIEHHHLSMAEAAAGAVVEFLSDLDLPVRAAAGDALGRMGKPAARPLIDAALSSPDKDVRSNGTRALQAIGDVAVPEMIESLRGGSPSQRVGCATAVGKLNSTRAVDALIGALGAKSGDTELIEVQLACRDALVALGKSAGKGSEIVVKPLITALADKDAVTRQHTCEALGELEDARAAADLIKVLKDDNRLVRLAAAYAVGKVRDKSATPDLIAKLSDRDREMREAAATSLGQIADPAAVNTLIAALRDPVDKVREQAAASLGRIAPSDAAALAAIAAIAGGGDEGARSAAVFSLGRIGNAGSVAPLAARLDAKTEPSVTVRRRAAQALGEIKSPTALEALVAAFADPDWRVNYAAAAGLAALGKVATPRLLTLLGEERDPLTARYARKALVAMTPPPVADLAAVLRSGQPSARLNVVLALGEIRDPASLKLLDDLKGDPDAQIRAAADSALNTPVAPSGEEGAATPVAAPAAKATPGAKAAPAEAVPATTP